MQIDGVFRRITCESNLKFLCDNSQVILADGTFYTAPEHFGQIYTIHAWNRTPNAYCLLSKLTTEIYYSGEKILSLIQENTPKGNYCKVRYVKLATFSGYCSLSHLNISFFSFKTCKCRMRHS